MTKRQKLEPRDALVTAVRRRAAELEGLPGTLDPTGGRLGVDVLEGPPRRHGVAFYKREQFLTIALGPAGAPAPRGS